jgi:YfiH family protein
MLSGPLSDKNLDTAAVAPILCHGMAALAPEIRHGFFTRKGGRSVGLYRSLNCGLGSADDREPVLLNRGLVAAWMQARDGFLATPHQVHSTDVLFVGKPWQRNERPIADAVITNVPGIALGVLTADCGPILFADAQAGVVAATHAGWKGAFGGICENTIDAMERLGAKREHIVASLGPTISQSNYEVGPEFVDRLLALAAENARYLAKSATAGHAHFDLPAYIVDRLAGAGVKARWTGQCTYADSDRFFSFRRTTHSGEPDYGRQISCILIRE